MQRVENMARPGTGAGECGDAKSPVQMAEISPLLTIVIVNWNNWAKLQNCLNSIYTGWLPASQVIVIDNNSSDGSQERLAQLFPCVELHCNAINIGHTKAINQGFSLARGRYILVLDNDTELEPYCIERLINFSEANQDVAMAAPRTFNSDGTIQESARRFPGIMSGLFGRQSVLTRLFPGNHFSKRYLARDFLEAKKPFEVEQIGGAFMLFRRDVLASVGVWDERYFGYWVDTDWCRSIRQKQLRIYCVPEARATHHESNARHKRKTARRIWIFHFGAYQYYTKWHSRGYWDPRSVFAGLLLVSRALMLMLANRLRPRDENPRLPTGASVQLPSE
jgi:N-acetylglucosaminyl-diphospho-decaprenol L-rhamnosyltransferase